MPTDRAFVAALVLVVSAPAWLAAQAEAPHEVPTLEIVSDDKRLAVEVLDEGVIHFEFAPKGVPRRSHAWIPTTPMVLRPGRTGPKRLVQLDALDTSVLGLRVDPMTLCLDVTNRTEPPSRLTTLCPEAVGGDRNVLSVAQATVQNVYGLGEHFLAPGEANGDLLGKAIAPGTATGNALTAFDGGFTENAQFPILYALGSAGESYALFLDQLDAQTWDLTGDPWRVTMAGEAIRGYLLAGTAPAALHRRYMRLVGRPPVPPKKAFGLWVSEFGFDNWAELEDKLRTLRAKRFPVDGFMLDLQWFGGVFRRPSHMGALTWDTASFPHPEREIARLRRDEGVGLMLIEEPTSMAADPTSRRWRRAGIYRGRARDVGRWASSPGGEAAACSTGPTPPRVTTGTIGSGSGWSRWGSSATGPTWASRRTSHLTPATVASRDAACTRIATCTTSTTSSGSRASPADTRATTTRGGRSCCRARGPPASSASGPPGGPATSARTSRASPRSSTCRCTWPSPASTTSGRTSAASGGARSMAA